MAKKKGGMSAGSLIGGILVVLTAMVLIVNLGLWTPMSKIPDCRKSTVYPS